MRTVSAFHAPTFRIGVRMSRLGLSRRALNLLARPLLGVVLVSACGDDTAVSDTSTGSSSGGPVTPDGDDDAPQPATSLDTTVGMTADDTMGDDGLSSTSTGDEPGTDGSSSSSDGSESGETGDPPNPPDPPGRTIVCDDQIAAAPAGQVCDVTPGGSTVLLQGTVLAGFDVYENGSVLVDRSEPNGRILCAGCDCGDAPEAVGAAVVACAEGVISPGLVNPHDHITFTLSQPVPHGTERYDHRHDWRLGLDGHTELNNFPGADSSREGVLYGEVRMLFGGATSITGSVGGANAAGLLRNLDNVGLTEGLIGVDVNYRTFPLGDTGGEMLTNGCDYPFIDAPSNLSSDIYLPHISEGITDEAQNEFECLSGGAGGEALIAPNTSVIHGIGVRPDDIAEMAEVGAMLVWSPRSNVDLYGITADIPTYRNLGVRIALGTDWTASGSVNVLRELQCADSFNQAHLDGMFSDVELWLMSTYWAAASQGADDQIGLIRPGHIADLAIFDGSTATHHRAVIEAEPSDVALVMRGGQALYGEATAVEGLVAAADLAGCETVDVCTTNKRMCAELDTGLAIGAIQAAVNAEAYGMVFCGTPDDEPSCDPARPDEFPDRGGPDDADGDGVADDDDNCPSVFNPIRPLDLGIQGDIDGDDIGDACDVCPLEQGQACLIPSVFDLDGDGVEDPDDNCLHVANPAQTDTDADGRGDECDACPDVPNPGGSLCPATIYEVKDGTIATGGSVLVEDVLVTGVGSNGYFVQVHPDDDEYVGPEFSGLFVFNQGLAFPAVGDRVSASGNVSDFFGQTQLVATGDPVVLSSGNPPPLPEPTTIAEIVEGGLLAEELEGVVVVVFDAVVSDIAPLPGPGDNAMNEFEVQGGLRVNDFLYLVSPFPTVGQTYTQISGIARWANGFTKLEPRGMFDLPPTLVGFGDAQSWLLVGTMGEPVPGLSAQLSGIAFDDTVVNLTYEDPSIVTGPASVVVSAGTSASPVILTGVATGTADVTAELDGVSISTTVQVYDDADPRVPTLVPTMVSVTLGASVDLTVELNLPAPAGGQTVDLSLLPGTCASVTPQVVVPAGELSTTFTVDGGDCTGDELLTASIGGAASDALVSVVDSPVFPDLVLAEVYYDHTGEDTNFEWVKIYNGTGAPVNLAGYSLGWGGTDYTYGTLQLAGVIPSSGCFVVGGPSGDVDSGSPVFGQAVDFNPDIQNSGATADGVALFAVTAGSVNAATVPIDVVIYGGANTNGLIDETGAPAAVDVADGGSAESMQRQNDNTWAIAPDPAPSACLPLP
jgi:hypothetical protein